MHIMKEPPKPELNRICQVPNYSLGCLGLSKSEGLRGSFPHLEACSQLCHEKWRIPRKNLVARLKAIPKSLRKPSQVELPTSIPSRIDHVEGNRIDTSGRYRLKRIGLSKRRRKEKYWQTKKMEAKTSLLALALVSCLLGFPGGASASLHGKVAVDFYSESLCPYCSNFVVNYLSKIVNNGVIDIVDLRIIPYGNAKVYPTGEIVCQHGEDECKLNIIQTCAVRLWPKVSEWFPFVLCLEKLVEDLPRSEVYPKWKTCVEPSGLSLELLEKCSEGPLGDMVEREFGAETDSLIPPHRYVPWVVVDGTPLYDDYVYIERAVCQAYKGSNAPSVCERYNGAGDAMIESVLEKEDSVIGVCPKV